MAPQPRKERPPQDPRPAPIGAAKRPARGKRPSYPTEPLAEGADVEFLRSLADLCNARADEVEAAKAKRNAQ
jgi:hypothetical protein